VNARDKTELRSRLKRITGQVTGLQRMLEEDRPLLDVITQVSAVRAALGGVTNILLASHVEERANEVLAAPNERERRELVGELVRLVQKRDV
jgi:DNA-binding FrmR family transcriptional regulator